VNENTWLIWFEDAGVRPEVFTGEGAADAANLRFHALKDNWNCHLFVKVEPIPPPDEQLRRFEEMMERRGQGELSPDGLKQLQELENALALRPKR